MSFFLGREALQISSEPSKSSYAEPLMYLDGHRDRALAVTAAIVPETYIRPRTDFC